MGGGFNFFALLDDDATSPELNGKGESKYGTGPGANGKTNSAAAAGKKPFKALVITTTQTPAPAARAHLPNQVQNHPTNGHVLSHRSPANGAEKAFPHGNWCGVCRLVFLSKLSLQNHIKQTPGHEYYCNKCVRTFKDLNGLKNHRDNTADHDIFCNLCFSAFDHKGGLRNHFENNYSKSDHSYACLICLEGFRTDKELEAHRKNAQKHVWCATCQIRFKNQNHRDRHWEIAEIHKHCLEPGCDFDTSNASDLALHLKCDHSSCDHCGKLHPSATKLFQHLEKECKRQPDLSTRLEKAIITNDRVTTSASVDNSPAPHPPSETSDASEIHCVFCKTVVKDEINLLKHLETDKCEKLPSSSKHLAILMGRWWFSVKYMDVGIHYQIRTGRYDLSTLMDSIKNMDIHPYICRGECDKTFPRLSSLVYHLKNSDCDWNLDDLEFDRLMRYLPRMRGFEGWQVSNGK